MKLPEEQLRDRIEITSRITGKWANLSSYEEAGVTIILNQLAIMEVLQKLLREE
jgi:hypothetical protein